MSNASKPSKATHISRSGKPVINMTLVNLGYENLANAIIIQAAKDYRSATLRLAKDDTNVLACSMQNDCMHFFASNWFDRLCSLDGQKVLERLKRSTNMEVTI